MLGKLDQAKVDANQGLSAADSLSGKAKKNKDNAELIHELEAIKGGKY